MKWFGILQRYNRKLQDNVLRLDIQILIIDTKSHNDGLWICAKSITWNDLAGQNAYNIA